jgi:hypothetical protein
LAVGLLAVRLTLVVRPLEIPQWRELFFHAAHNIKSVATISPFARVQAHRIGEVGPLPVAVGLARRVIQTALVEAVATPAQVLAMAVLA